MLTVPVGEEAPSVTLAGMVTVKGGKRADDQLDGLGGSIRRRGRVGHVHREIVGAGNGWRAAEHTGRAERQPGRRVRHQRRRVCGKRGGAIEAGKGVVGVVAGRDPNRRRKPGHCRAVVELDIPICVQHGLEVDGVVAGLAVRGPADDHVTGVAGHENVVTGRGRCQVLPEGGNPRCGLQRGVAVRPGRRTGGKIEEPVAANPDRVVARPVEGKGKGQRQAPTLVVGVPTLGGPSANPPRARAALRVIPQARGRPGVGAHAAAGRQRCAVGEILARGR